MNKISPIQTRYKGFHFRSRLEARWAVFFDALEVRWEYEFEGFQLAPGERYLPDFYLPDMKVWIEIKPEIQTENITSSEMWRKAKGLVDGLLAKVDGNTEQEVFYIAFGTPGIAKFSPNGDSWKLISGSVMLPVRKTINILELKSFAMVDGGDHLDIWPIYAFQDNGFFLNPVLPKGFIPRMYNGRGIQYEAENLKSAYNATRSARFEFGESGAT